MNLKVSSSDRDVHAVVCKGEITHENLLDNRNPLEELIGGAGFANKIMIDLSGVTLIDSSGIGWLIRIHQRCTKANGILYLHSLSQNVNHVFELMQLPTQLHVAVDESEAILRLDEL